MTGDLFGQVNVTPWDRLEQPSEEAVYRKMVDEGLQPYRWTNDPGDVYPAHRHPYHKVVYVVRGSIRFELSTGRLIDLTAGDRLDMPAGTQHSAVVGPEGVVCLEAHLPPRD